MTFRAANEQGGKATTTAELHYWKHGWRAGKLTEAGHVNTFWRDIASLRNSELGTETISELSERGFNTDRYLWQLLLQSSSGDAGGRAERRC